MLAGMATCREGHVSLTSTGWWTQLATDYSGSRQQGAVKKNHLLLYGELAFSLCELAIPPLSKWTRFACFFLHLETSDQAVFSDLSPCQANGEEAEGDIELRPRTHWALEPVWKAGYHATQSDGGIWRRATESYLPNSAAAYKNGTVRLGKKPLLNGFVLVGSNPSLVMMSS